jgi:hypothetical protein
MLRQLTRALCWCPAPNIFLLLCITLGAISFGNCTHRRHYRDLIRKYPKIAKAHGFGEQA